MLSVKFNRKLFSKNFNFQLLEMFVELKGQGEQ